MSDGELFSKPDELPLLLLGGDVEDDPGTGEICGDELVAGGRDFGPPKRDVLLAPTIDCKRAFSDCSASSWFSIERYSLSYS